MMSLAVWIAHKYKKEKAASVVSQLFFWAKCWCAFCCLQGEATSAQLIGQAIANNPAFITLRRIEASREIAQTISNSSNRVFLNSNDLLLNLHDMDLGSSAGGKK